MNRFCDYVGSALLLTLAVCGLVSFIKLITIGDIALGTCGLVVFILFGLALVGAGDEEDW